MDYSFLCCQFLIKKKSKQNPKQQRSLSPQLFIFNCFTFNVFTIVQLSLKHHFCGFWLVSLVPVLLMLAFCNCHPFL